MTLEQNYQYILEKAPLGRGMFSSTQKAAIAAGGGKLIASYSQPAIVKTLAPQLRDRPEFDRFARHFHDLSCRLIHCHHPHLASVLDCFEEGGQPYIVYEAIAGRSLAEILEAEGTLPPAQAVRYIQQVADAIATLHAAGLKHLDINPQNILKRDDRDDAIAIEVGLTCELAPAIKQTHANLLSPGYAAPEQHQPDAPCTPATDIYALAATLYCLLAGSPPPPAPLLDRIPAADWQRFPSYISECTKAAILQGLILDPAQRPQTVEDWLSLLTSPQAANWEESQPVAEETPTVRLEEAEAIAQISSQTANLEEPELETSDPTNQSPRPPITPSPHPSIPPSIKSEGERAVTLERLQAAKIIFSWLGGAKLKKNQTTLPQKFPMRALLVTCAIAASAGAGFGLSLRLNRPEEAGSSMWHLKQSFPPRDNDSSPTDNES